MTPCQAAAAERLPIQHHASGISTEEVHIPPYSVMFFVSDLFHCGLSGESIAQLTQSIGLSDLEAMKRSIRIHFFFSCGRDFLIQDKEIHFGLYLGFEPLGYIEAATDVSQSAKEKKGILQREN